MLYVRTSNSTTAKNTVISPNFLVKLGEITIFSAVDFSESCLFPNKSKPSRSYHELLHKIGYISKEVAILSSFFRIFVMR